MYQIPVYQPSIGENEKKYVNQCLDTSWISSKGEFIKRFEESFSRYLGSRHAITVSNGTVALHLALLGLGIKPGDEVIVPTFTYIASVNAIRYCGATPVFVDSLPDTWQMDPKEIEKKITQRTAAIMVVHLYGHPANMTEISNIAERHGIPIVEDCAEAFGTRFNDRKVGTLGKVSTFSFFGNKTITTGEGGMVVTDDSRLYEDMLKLRGQGLVPGREYWHDVIGYNYRMTNICAAIGLAQLERADQIIEKKRVLAGWYKKYLHESGAEIQPEMPEAFHTYWMVSVLMRDQTNQLKAREALRGGGVETRPLFPPIHLMPMYAEKDAHYPVAEELAKRGINLPSYPELTEKQVEYICGIVKASQEAL